MGEILASMGDRFCVTMCTEARVVCMLEGEKERERESERASLGLD
jgi:hypothetical protein